MGMGYESVGIFTVGYPSFSSISNCMGGVPTKLKTATPGGGSEGVADRVRRRRYFSSQIWKEAGFGGLKMKKSDVSSFDIQSALTPGCQPWPMVKLQR